MPPFAPATSPSETPQWANIDKLYNFGVSYVRVELLPLVDTVPLGTEPDWQVWIGGLPKAILGVAKWTGTPNLINVHTTFGGGYATRIVYTYNPARPILDTAGSPLPSFDHLIPWP